ncbi:hypothetical protein [Empedobacter brevis]|nr:hypothetical protein [Empedobacter brevis]
MAGNKELMNKIKKFLDSSNDNIGHCIPEIIELEKNHLKNVWR